VPFTILPRSVTVHNGGGLYDDRCSQSSFEFHSLNLGRWARPIRFGGLIGIGAAVTHRPLPHLKRTQRVREISTSGVSPDITMPHSGPFSS